MRDAEAAAPLPAARFVERARAGGSTVSLVTVAGEPFWASTEIVRLPTLVEQTAAALGGGRVTSPGRRAPENRANA